MTSYIYFTNTIDQYKINLKLQNIVTCIGTYDLVPPKPNKGATLNWKIFSPSCIGT